MIVFTALIRGFISFINEIRNLERGEIYFIKSAIHPSHKQGPVLSIGFFFHVDPSPSHFLYSIVSKAFRPKIPTLVLRFFLSKYKKTFFKSFYIFGWSNNFKCMPCFYEVLYRETTVLLMKSHCRQRIGVHFVWMFQLEVNRLISLQVAVVADRALLAVFVLVTSISTAAILLPQFNNLHVGNTPLKPPT